MTFSSIPFLFYFLPAVLVCYYVFAFTRTLKNLVLVLFSLAFYAWGEPKYILLLAASIVANYLLGLLAGLAKGKKRAGKFWLVSSILFNVGMLFIYKYLTFVTKNISFIDGGKTGIINITMPIGISFFTFHAISQAIDVYRKDIPPQRNLLNFALYMAFFPKLTQGPITKYKTFAPQMLDRQETLRKFSSGACLLVVGLGKKVLLANNMAIVADRVFTLSGMGGIPASLAWLGAAAYTLQIYFDFSGYSDMAIGLGLMFGFKLDQNFNYPYISKSIREFWRRWHITLSMWFQDYVYFPLGGSRVANKDIVVRNLAIVWILTGIWHGANWTFLVWGIFNFVFLVFERITQWEKLKIPGAIQHVYALFVIMIGWVIFRSDSLESAGAYLGCMFNFAKGGVFSPYTVMFLKEYGVFFLAAILFSTPFAAIVNQILAKGILTFKSIEANPPYSKHSIYIEPAFAKVANVVYPLALAALFLVCTAYLIKGTYNPFIYFQF